MEKVLVMKSLDIWLKAFRPRTLLLVVAGTLSAAAVALPYGINYIALTLVLLTALSLQILSNISNDYGDTKHGADSDERIGPTRVVQAGLISSVAMRKAIVAASIITIILGGLLTFYTYRMVGPIYFSAFVLAGAAAIWAAIAYTATSKPYGYVGLGDIMVFVFFGLVMVVGGSWLMAGLFIVESLFVGVGLGFLATAVLNINNMRDLQTDQAGGKLTVAVRLGPHKARYYHSALIIAAIVAFTVFSILRSPGWLSWLWLLTVPLLMGHVLSVNRTPPHLLDRLLPQLVLLTSAISLMLLTASVFAV